MRYSVVLKRATLFYFYGEKMTCCFIGHRKIEDKEMVAQKVREVVEGLIIQNRVRIFHFGSRSQFDDICHAVVTEFQRLYPEIVRVNYNVKSEYVVKKGEKEGIAKEIDKWLEKKSSINDFEKSKISDRVFNAGKASYVERNEEMIDDSEYCVFFYKENYIVQSDEKDKPMGNSGTKRAYCYAVKKKKKIINIAGKI